MDVKPGETVRVAGRRHRPAGRRPARPAGGRSRWPTSSSATAASLSTARPEAADPGRLPRLHRRAASRPGGTPSARRPRVARISRMSGSMRSTSARTATFRIEDVPAGQYVLRLPFDGRTERRPLGPAGLRSGRCGRSRDAGRSQRRAARTSAQSHWTVFRVPRAESRRLRTGGHVQGRGRHARSTCKPCGASSCFWHSGRRITSETLADVSDLKGDDTTPSAATPGFVMIGLSQDIEPRCRETLCRSPRPGVGTAVPRQQRRPKPHRRRFRCALSAPGHSDRARRPARCEGPPRRTYQGGSRHGLRTEGLNG